MDKAEQSVLKSMFGDDIIERLSGLFSGQPKSQVSDFVISRLGQVRSALMKAFPSSCSRILSNIDIELRNGFSGNTD